MGAWARRQLAETERLRALEAERPRAAQAAAGSEPEAAPSDEAHLAPETELTVHFYGHGAKLYENSIVMRWLVLLCP